VKNISCFPQKIIENANETTGWRSRALPLEPFYMLLAPRHLRFQRWFQTALLSEELSEGSISASGANFFSPRTTIGTKL
jgi:hypothetical protein